MTRLSLPRIAAGAAVAGLVALAAAPAGALPHPFSPPSRSTTTTAPGAPGGQAGPNTSAGPNTAAGPNSSQSLQAIQAAADAAIAARIAFLNRAVTDLGKVPPGCAVSGLISTAQSDIAGLTTLKGTIDSDTTVAQARMDAQKIFTEFRVFALVGPVDEMVVAACRITDVANKIEALVGNLQGVKDPQIAALLADMNSEALAAANEVSGLASTLEGYTPQDWNSNHSLLKGARQSLQQAREDLEKARQDGHKIMVIVHHDLAGNGGNNVNPNSSTSTTASTPSTSTTSTTAA